MTTANDTTIAVSATANDTTVAESATATPATILMDAMQRAHDSQTLFRGRLRVRLGIGATDLSAMQFIIRAEGRGAPARARDLTRMLGVTSAAASVIIDRLEHADLVERRADAGDRRSRTLALTDSGRISVHEIIGPTLVELDALLGALSAEQATCVSDLATAVTELLDRSVLAETA